MSESIQALIKACVCRGESGINMEMPPEPHKTVPVSCVTSATTFPCAAEADGHAGERRKQLFLLGESSFLSSSMSCPSKSVLLKGQMYHKQVKSYRDL